eukprot:10756141-Alexandrium_andersonii.AAC.1
MGDQRLEAFERKKGLGEGAWEKELQAVSNGGVSTSGSTWQRMRRQFSPEDLRGYQGLPKRTTSRPSGGA